MYNALNWVKNKLIYTSNCKGESDQEFNGKLKKNLKGYNNTIIISGKVIAPTENIIRMDMEFGDKHVKTVEVICNEDEEKVGSRSNIILTNETGDVLKYVEAVDKPQPKGSNSKEVQIITETKPRGPITFTQSADKSTTTRTKSKTEFTCKELMSQECTMKQTEKMEELKRERGQNDDNAEVLGIPLPFRSIGERSSLTDLHNLWEQCPQPQPPLINKQLKTLQLNADQAVIMAEQVKKMKNGMERLQEIIKKFNCTEKFKQDIDFIIANVGPAIAKAEKLRRSDQSVSKMRGEKESKKE